MEKISFTAACLMILFVSFMGFVTENIWLAFTKGYIDNRNMHLPFLLGYGLLMMFTYYLLGLPTNRTTYFLQAAIIVMVGETLLGSLVEKVCHFNWWNYTWLPLHINKYTSVPTTIAFALIITFFMDQLFEPLMEFFEGMADGSARVIAPMLILILTIDLSHSFYRMYVDQGTYRTWYVSVHEKAPALKQP